MIRYIVLLAETAIILPVVIALSIAMLAKHRWVARNG
jgi:hypothetical protein